VARARKLWFRLRSLGQRGRLEGELDAELAHHLELEAQKNVRGGMSPEAARRAARISLGGVEQVKEEARDAWGASALEGLRQDVRYGLRGIRKNPAFAAVVVLTLGLGIGANTAIFSVVNGVLLRPLPYGDPARLVVVRQSLQRPATPSLGFSEKELLDYRSASRTLEGLVEYHTMSFTLLGGREAERVQTGVVSHGFFDFLGVEPLLGRAFRPEDDQPGAEAVLVLSHDYWKRRHGGDPAVVGRVFRMNNRPHTVIGVLPNVPQFPNENDVYMPSSACPFRSAATTRENRGARMLSVYGRLKPGASLEQARADVATVARRLEADHAGFYPAGSGFTATTVTLGDELTLRARPTLLVLLGAVACVLLIACANVANLMLARMLRRGRELAMRAALGAGRVRLVRQLLVESTLLALLGGALGLALASAGLDLLVRFTARFTTRASEVGIDGWVLGFTLFASVLTGLLFGALPALTARPELAEVMKEENTRAGGGGGPRRARALLVVSQVAFSFMLLIAAGLMLRSFVKLQQVDAGFRPENVLTARLSLNWSKYDEDEKVRRFGQQLIRNLEADPDVRSAALSFSVPLAQAQPFNRRFAIEGRPVEERARPTLDFRVVSPRYFETIGQRLVRGRSFEERDDERAAPVALVNQAFARHYWGDGDPIGSRVSFGGDEERWVTIVGVVGDVRYYGLDREPTLELYEPFAQNPGWGAVLVRTRAEPRAALALMSRAVHAIDPEQPVDRIRTLAEVRAESVASPRLTAILLGIFALVALVITAAGIGGVLALSVSQRTTEIGVRMAMGAERGAVMRMVLEQGLGLVLAGLALGLVGALALSRLVERLLFGVPSTDPLTYAVVAAMLLAAAVAACLLPARRAASVDPLVALRHG
jgi:putative ABC transport system permease protein